MAKKSKQGELVDSAHKVWLAGLGALASAGTESERLFHTLVRRGETLEKQIHGPVAEAGARVSDTVKQARARAGETLDSISNTIDDTVTAALGRLGVPSREEIASLGKRVEKLTRAVDAKKKAAAGKTTTRKSTAKTTAKKKATARKPAGARKTARKKTAKPQATA